MAAILPEMFSGEYLEAVRKAHREGGMPTVNDPAREGRAGQ